MRTGHREAQEKFLSTGRLLGHEVRRSFDRRWPTDGVWMTRASDGIAGGLPLVAIEVLVSEGPKTLRGSLGVLEAVSPALGVLLVQEDDIARRLRVRGASEAQIAAHLRRMHDHINEYRASVRQRTAVWTYQQLLRQHELIVASRSAA